MAPLMMIVMSGGGLFTISAVIFATVIPVTPKPWRQVI